MKAYSIPNTQVSELSTSYMVMHDASNNAGLQMGSGEIEGPQIQ